MKKSFSVFYIMMVGILLTTCKSTECLKKEQASYVTDMAKDWPFMLKINWWTYAGNWHVDTVSIDSNGIVQKKVRGIQQFAARNYSNCPVIYGETLTLSYPISPFFIFKSINIYKPEQGGLLILETLPIDTGAYQGYVATYDLKTLTYKSLASDGTYYGYFEYKPRYNPTSYPQNAVKIDSIQSFNKIYYNVWKFVVSLNSYPLGYKTLYFDPSYGLIRCELNNGSIVDIQP